MEDSKIIQMFFARSEKAIAALSEKYGKACFKTAFGILNNREDSEECVNDSYLKAWNSIPPQEPDPLSSYILKIVRNCSLNRLEYNQAKKRASNITTCLEELGYELVSGSTPEKSFENKELLGYVEHWLRTLGKTNRILFVRRYWFVDSFDELSELTGLKTGTIKVRLLRMRSDLKEFLAAKGAVL